MLVEESGLRQVRSPVGAERLLERADGVWSSAVQDLAVLYSSQEGKAIVLNATGAALWEALESPCTLTDLADLLVRRFPDLSIERARADVGVFLDRLLSESAVRPLP